MFEEYSDMLTVDEVAEILGVGKNSAYEIFRSGEMDCFMLRVNGKFLSRHSLTTYIKKLIRNKLSVSSNTDA